MSCSQIWGMFIACEAGGRADDGPVYVAGIVEDCSAAAAASDERDGGEGRRVGGVRGEEGEIDFEPGVLVPAEDYAGGVGVEEEDCRGWGRGLEEVVFDGEVGEWVAGSGDVGLYRALEGCGEGGGEGASF